ncbi:MAG: hypothetical protein II956_08210 [Bacteroidales bacterium]|nr:hypothetical protein [Bacteroidales bacterium]
MEEKICINAGRPVYFSYARNSHRKPEWEHISDCIDPLLNTMTDNGLEHSIDYNSFTNNIITYYNKTSKPKLTKKVKPTSDIQTPQPQPSQTDYINTPQIPPIYYQMPNSQEDYTFADDRTPQRSVSFIVKECIWLILLSACMVLSGIFAYTIIVQEKWPFIGLIAIIIILLIKSIIKTIQVLVSEQN